MMDRPEEEGFLSCLHGSEPEHGRRAAATGFLSCLHGSERSNSTSFSAAPFLSCLHGSELEHIKINMLIVKEL